MRPNATGLTEGFADILQWGETNMRELFLGIIPLAIGFYFSFSTMSSSWRWWWAGLQRELVR